MIQSTCSARCAVTLLAALLIVSPRGARAGTIEGVVRDEATMMPLADAIVSLQASGIRTTTAADGSYALTVPDGTNLVIVAAHKGYFNESILVTVGKGGVVDADIEIDFVPQDDDPGYRLVNPLECRDCHPNQYNEWIDSPMQKAGLNTWVHDIYNGTGTPGGMGGFVYTRDSVHAGSNPNSECASCHQPESWIYALPDFSRMEGPQDPSYPSDTSVHGISCDVCHKIAHVNVEQINYPGIFPGALDYTRPAGEDPMQVQYGLLGDADYTAPFSMRPSYQPQLAAEVCAACHQDAADPDKNHTFTGVISEPTYLEWADSPYADPASPYYADCVDCHMPPSGEDRVCEVLFLPRDPETIRTHTILGSTPEYLENAAEVTVTADAVGNELQVEVEVYNAYTGHHLPTGVTVRNMILLVEAWRDMDGEPLEFTGDQVVHDLGGVGGDPAEGYYGGLPGRYFSKVNHDASGNGPTFFTDATGIEFDNRIPALQSDFSHYTFEIPPGAGPLRVRARLIYRRAFRFLVDAKEWTQNGHGEPLADVQAPHYGHLMEDVEVLVACGPEDLDGDSRVGFSDLLAVLRAWGPCAGCPEDLDGDGAVGFADILRVLTAWGPCP